MNELNFSTANDAVVWLDSLGDAATINDIKIGIDAFNVSSLEDQISIVYSGMST